MKKETSKEKEEGWREREREMKEERERMLRRKVREGERGRRMSGKKE